MDKRTRELLVRPVIRPRYAVRKSGTTSDIDFPSHAAE